MMTILVNTLLMFTSIMLFDFSPGADLSRWTVVDDVVMGGRSAGQFFVNAEGHGVSQGRVPLDNNGGFSSVRYRFAQRPVEGATQATIRLKGDGKRYQFRVKTSVHDRHSYIAYFQTTGEWQSISIPLREMYPTFRGRRLAMPDYPAESISEIAFLIANEKQEAFHLEIDRIGLERRQSD